MKKRLLSESSVRKFMKLANIQSLTENFLDETEGLEETQDVTEEVTEEIAEEGMGGVYARDDEAMEGELDAPMDDAPMDDAPVDDAPMDDAPMDDAPAGETVSIDVEQLVNDIVGALNAQGADVSMDSDDAGDLDADLASDEPPAMEDEEAPMMEDDMAPMMEEDSLEEQAADEDMVAEVTRRVAQRILQTQTSGS